MEIRFSVPLKTRLVNREYPIVTVDLGENNYIGYYRVLNGAKVKFFRFNTNPEIFVLSWDTVRSAMKYQLGRAVVGFESIG